MPIKKHLCNRTTMEIYTAVRTREIAWVCVKCGNYGLVDGGGCPTVDGNDPNQIRK